jgi:hypothetical protein
MLAGTSDLNYSGFVRDNPGLLGGADSVVLIEPHAGKAAQLAAQSRPPGLLYLSFSDSATFMGTVRVFNYSAPSGRMLSWAHGNDSGNDTAKLHFTSWKEATPAQREEIHSRIVAAMQKSLQEALGRAGL